MRTPRFILADIQTQLLSTDHPNQFFLSKSESHHLAHVLRREPGTLIEVTDGSGFNCVCKIIEFTENGALCSFERKKDSRDLSNIVLLVAAVAPAKCDLIVEKAVELGVAEIHFFRAERSQESLKPEQIEKRISRFERIAEAAVKQSGAPRLPLLTYANNMSALLTRLHGPDNQHGPDFRTIFVAPDSAAEYASAGEARSAPQNAVITSLFQLLERGPQGAENHLSSTLEEVSESVDSYALVGPEGGFTGKEIALALQWNYIPASLGPNVLRTETAVILALGLIGLFRFSKTEG